jgi:hypothetical protein
VAEVTWLRHLTSSTGNRDILHGDWTQPPLQPCIPTHSFRPAYWWTEPTIKIVHHGTGGRTLALVLTASLSRRKESSTSCIYTSISYCITRVVTICVIASLLFIYMDSRCNRDLCISRRFQGVSLLLRTAVRNFGRRTSGDDCSIGASVFFAGTPSCYR